MFILRFLLCVVFSSSFLAAQNYIILSGKVVDESNIPLEGCNIILTPGVAGTTTDESGLFSIRLTEGIYHIKVSYVGFSEYNDDISLFRSTDLNTIKLTSKSYQNEEVIVTADKEVPEIVASELKSRDLKKMPVLYNDVLRAVKILPGVTSNNELSSGYNVRGGNFNENIVYLNGFEIYRPFLLRQGMEENQTIINPDLVENMRFYGGAFPVQYGGKMSSVLEVEYDGTQDTAYRGSVRADLLNAGVTIGRRFGKFNIAAGVRYASPGLFLSELHTSGDYKPTFADIQVLGNYEIDDKRNIELLFLSADNGFDLTPDEWLGHFKSDRGGEVNQVAIDFNGYKNYSFKTNLAGIKYKQLFSNSFKNTVKLSYYNTRENEDADYTGDYWYSPDAEVPEDGKEYLKSSHDMVKNSLNLNSVIINDEVSYKLNDQEIYGGIEYKYEFLEDRINEFYNEEGNEALLTYPSVKVRSNDYNINTFSLFSGYKTVLWEYVKLDAGLRYTHTSITDENLISPRMLITITPNPIHTFKLGYGYYYQSPFFHELRSLEQGNPDLRSQKSVHYILGWEYRFRHDFTMQAEVYYKDIPRMYSFYEEQFRTVYMTDKFFEGYATGLDVQFRGKLSEGLNSWIGYSYLDSKERELGSDADYERRILDQTHTIQIFIQDKMPGRKNFESHLRLLFGSGYLYNNRKLVEGENDQIFLKVEPRSKGEILNYMRADMGLTATFDVAEGRQLIVTAEVLNVFNNYNIAGYEWIQAFKDIQYPVRIPQMYSKRFFNVGIEYTF